MHMRIIVSPVIANPPLVHRLILSRLDAIDAFLILLDPDRATGRTTGTNTGMRIEEPNALLVQKVFIAQSANGTQINDIARELVV
jgi:hypothetical protein